MKCGKIYPFLERHSSLPSISFNNYGKRSLRRSHSLLHYLLSLYFSKDSKELVALIRAFLFHGKLSASNLLWQIGKYITSRVDTSLYIMLMAPFLAHLGNYGMAKLHQLTCINPKLPHIYIKYAICEHYLVQNRVINHNLCSI